LGDDDAAADRNYIREFVLAHDRQLGQKYGVEFAEAFHYIGPPTAGMEDTIRQSVVPLK
jgi:protein-disulfide isomerase-like protein with CxxC motif